MDSSLPLPQPLLLVSEKEQTFLSISLASLLAFCNWPARGGGSRNRFQLQFLVPMWVGCVLRHLAVPRSQGRHGLDESPGGLREAHLWCQGSLAPGEGFGWTFLAAAETVFFPGSSLFLPLLSPGCQLILFPGGTERCFWKLQDQVSPRVCTQLTSLLSTEGHLDILLIVSDLCLTLSPVKGLPVSRYLYLLISGFPDAQLVKNLPEMQETLVGSLGQEDLLEKG